LAGLPAILKNDLLLIVLSIVIYKLY